jgi:hypothetical protein
MSNHQINFTKEADERNSESRAASLTRCLTLMGTPPKLSPLSPAQFATSNIRRGASEKRSNMAVVATVAGISIEIKYGYTTPVFFAVTSHGQAMIELPTLTVSFSTLLPQQLQTVLQWANSRTSALSREWSKTNNNLPVGTVT